MYTMQCKNSRAKMLVISNLLCLLVVAFQGVGSQNSIKPRRSKTNLTHGVPSCPEVQVNDSISECQASCSNDEDCINHGDELKCCPSTSSKKDCQFECTKSVMTPNGGRVCYDFSNGRKYLVGDTFVKDGTCCRCYLGGIITCSENESCPQSCFYGSKYFNEGDFVLGSRCRNCTCHNGALYCKINPECSKGKCKYKGKIYKPEHIIKFDHRCKECVCENHGWKCTAITCNAERSVSSAVSLPVFETSLISLQVLLTRLLIS